MATPRPAQPGPVAPAGEESTFRRLISIAQQLFVVWAIMQFASNYFSGSKPQATVSSPGQPGDAPAVDARSLPPANLQLGWELGQRLDMHIYLTTSPNGDVFSNQWTSGWRENADKDLPNFVWENITFGNWKDSRTVEMQINFPPSVLRNGSLWADIILTKEGASHNPQNPGFEPSNVHHVRKLLTPYLPRTKVRKEKNLLSGSDVAVEEPEEEDYIAPHWHRNITIALISEAAALQYSTLPPPVLEHIQLIPGQRDDTGTIGYYKPVIFPNEFWHLREHYVELNHTTPSLPLQIVFQPMSFFKFQLYAAMTSGFKEAAKQQGSSGGAELDEVKRMFIETNPWFLGLTGLVSILHVVFEMLAFKSDVSHWRQKKEMVGVSIVTNVFVQLVILLYLIDNNENTSWMILFGSGIGVLVEAWKITKAVDIRIVAAPPGSRIPYKLDVKDKHVLSEDEKKTQEYDKLAFRYVSYVAVPTLAAYTGYSLLYNSHRGWYSFIISTLTSFVYMFGFAQLVPQLIINYKLKSVAHMPMKAMIYKTLSTVVDDFFAFCIKMPFLHRLACFRDDVVFLIFLYQRWIYRVDPKRINEYGQVMADIAAVESKKDR
ncbi:cleft lip and palate associated transmembrane protein, partial [Tricholoma matsutake]